MLPVAAATRYVWPASPNPAPPYNAWSNAAHAIQPAVDLAVDGETVWVSDGRYDTSTRVTPGQYLLNRLVITNDIRVRSVNGPGVTAIVGTGPVGSNAVRGVYMSAGTLEGFTITNGHTRTDHGTSGGGVLCHLGGSVYGCIIEGNHSHDDGGGIYLSDNSKALNCLIRGNISAFSGGGGHVAFSASMKHCTVVENHAHLDGGGLLIENFADVENCVIYYNGADVADPNYTLYRPSYSCTTPYPSGGTGNITNEPFFVDRAGGDFRLFAPYSPCIDSGVDQPAITNDLPGTSRPIDGNGDATVKWDMGAYEASYIPGTITNYVAPSGSHTWPYLTWETAATTLQAAVDAAVDGCLVLVSNGVYVLDGDVVVDKDMTVRSVNGPGTVTLDGNYPVATNRCVTLLHSNALVEGVTLRNGYADRGGGAYCSTGAMLRSCIVTECEASDGGGGIYLQAGAEAENCLVHHNRGGDGAGVYLDHGGRVRQCTVIANASSGFGGGLYHHDGGRAENSIFYYNHGHGQAEWYCASPDGDTQLVYCCTRPEPDGPGNVTNHPVFVDDSYENFHLATGSPCIDAGTNQPGITVDLDGWPRPVDGDGVPPADWDIGAYEYQPTLVDITNQNSTVYGEQSSITIGGTNLGTFVGSMVWTNGITGNAGTFPAAPSWQALVPLAFGPNPLTVSGHNLVNEKRSDSVVITRSDQHGGNSPVHYVSLFGSHSWPFTNWPAAATTIQAAVDSALPGDTVLVSNGVYTSGGAVTPGYTLSNRVRVTREVTLLSVNGPEHTCIKGGGGLGASAVRGVYLSAGSLNGFTVMEGATRTSGNDDYDRSGGGVLLDHGGTISNCVIHSCEALAQGGGVEFYLGGRMLRCNLFSNRAENGAGAFLAGSGLAHSSLFWGNWADGPGGGFMCDQGGTAMLCTVAGNVADIGGGVMLDNGGRLVGCIIQSNTAASADDNYGQDGSGYSYTYCCLSPLFIAEGNTEGPVVFVDPVRENDYHLGPGSACIDAGPDDPGTDDLQDLDGVHRPLIGQLGGRPTVDIGCYEFAHSDSDTDGDGMMDRWEEDHGLNATDAADAWEDSDGDGDDNQTEHVADTDPQDGENYFHLARVSRTNSCAVTFPCSTARVYTLEATVGLITNPWSAVSGQAGVPGAAGGTMTLVDTNDAHGCSYRAGVSVPHRK